MAAAKRAVTNEVLGTLIDGVKSEVGELKGAIKDMAHALNKLAAVESKQSDQTEQIARAFESIERVSSRVALIEPHMPGLKELRKWAIAGLLGGISLMLIAVAGLVLKPVPQIVVQYPQQQSQQLLGVIPNQN